LKDVERERNEIIHSYNFHEQFHLTLYFNSFDGALHCEECSLMLAHLHSSPSVVERQRLTSRMDLSLSSFWLVDAFSSWNVFWA